MLVEVEDGQTSFFVNLVARIISFAAFDGAETDVEPFRKSYLSQIQDLAEGFVFFSVH